MSFKPDISRVSIFNEALALLPSDPIQSADEGGLEARECRRFYNRVVATLLERHHWNLATKRGVLAQVANDREAEWTYAYAKPTDMAFPVRAFDNRNAGVGGWIMDGYAYIVGGKRLFMQARGTLYSSIEMATLEYTSFDINESDFSSIFADIVVLELAARICHPITKDDRRAEALATRAEVERSRAIAIDLNRNQPRYGDAPTESELVRGVGIPGEMFTGNYALDPVAHPSNTGN